MSAMARLISLTVLVTLIVVLGITFFQVIAPYLLPLFLAAIVAILCQPIFRYAIRRTNDRIRLAAGLTTAAVLFIAFVPLIVGTLIASIQLFTLAQETLGSPQWRSAVRTVREELRIDHLAARMMPYVYGTSTRELPSEEDGMDQRDGPQQSVTEPTSDVTAASEAAEKADVDRAATAISAAQRQRLDELQQRLEENLRVGLSVLSQRTMGVAGVAAGRVGGAALGILGALVSGLISMVMFVIALYYFLADGPALISAAERMIPVHVDYQRELLSKFTSVVRAVVSATFLAAITQGVMTATALVICGYGHFFVFVIVTTVTALIPFVGAWPVWMPFTIALFWQGHVLLGGFLAIAGLCTGGMDNVVRTYVLHTDVKLHPLLAFVSVLGGLQAMGLWGVFVGPIVASCLHALVKIFNMELKELSRARFGEAAQEVSRAAAALPAAEDNQEPASETAEPADSPGEQPSDVSESTARVSKAAHETEAEAAASKKRGSQRNLSVSKKERTARRRSSAHSGKEKVKKKRPAKRKGQKRKKKPGRKK